MEVQYDTDGGSCRIWEGGQAVQRKGKMCTVIMTATRPTESKGGRGEGE